MNEAFVASPSASSMEMAVSSHDVSIASILMRILYHSVFLTGVYASTGKTIDIRYPTGRIMKGSFCNNSEDKLMHVVIRVDNIANVAVVASVVKRTLRECGYDIGSITTRRYLDQAVSLHLSDVNPMCTDSFEPCFILPPGIQGVDIKIN